ncbi:ABC transporter permease subunit [Paenibacillus faecalis]|uniref:ABC transporter permease subunit n=1 Tax=Paenibacillus faecalis TaxID=2079532 RepID=UPI000D0E68AD|nr:ABC transporter permease subunit [Paenibacillus faecalis]
MNLRTQMLRTIGISLLAFVVIMLIVLFPRKLDFAMDGNMVVVSYEASMEGLIANIKQFFVDLFQNQSLGYSRFSGETAGEAVMRAMGRSLSVIGAALCIGFVFGILKGIVDYKLSKTRFNIFGHWTTWIFQSLPDFFVIIAIQWFIIDHFPFIRFFATDGWQSFVLSSILVSLYPIVYIASLTSASLASQEGKLYLLFAKAKGLNNRMILFKHMLSNSMSTLLIQLPILLVYILSNLLIVEIYRNYPGAAWRLYTAMDYNTYQGTGGDFEAGIVIGIVFCFMLLILLVQWISHTAKKYFDPI